MDNAARERFQVLFRRLREGDRAAVHPAFEIIWPPVLDLCRRALPNAADAEDAAMIAVEKLFERASAFDTGRDAVAWALGIAAFECKTARQKTRRRRETGEDGTERAAPGGGPEAEALTREIVEHARAVIASLEPADAEAIAAMIDEGERPRVSAAAFRKRLERALERLRAAWRNHELF